MATKKSEGASQRSRTEEAKLQREGWGANRSQRLEILKWEVGKVVSGKVTTLKKLPDSNEKKGGFIFYIETEEGRVCYGAPAILHGAMDEIITEHGGFDGLFWRIECIGKVPSRRGQEAWNFDVRTREA